MQATRTTGERIVGVGAMCVSNAPGDRLVAHALGSCLGVAVFDPVARVGGLLHVPLPSSIEDRDRSRGRPLEYVDTAVPALFRDCYKLGATKGRLRVAVAGGASAGDASADGFQIGKRNLIMLRKLLWKNGVLIHAHDVGGERVWRTISLDVASGCVWLKMPDREGEL
ncbi:MAG TPA: chemotaxis protein CheD [Gemmatimonadaceae bacterium]|nr:chemotaxis protein CheD [Gemmatimonadaceae bacterium]